MHQQVIQFKKAVLEAGFKMGQLQFKWLRSFGKAKLNSGRAVYKSYTSTLSLILTPLKQAGA